VYLECRTLIPNSAILIITATFALEDVEEQGALIQEILDTFTLEVGAETSLDGSDIEVIARLAAADIDSFWMEEFNQHSADYERPKYITFTGPVETACGEETSGEAGPFYCGLDETVYLDLDSLATEYVPLGIVVMESVIAHEVAHHVQNLLSLEGCADPDCGEPGGSLAIELQADCFSGAWTQDAASRGVIQASDVKRIDAAITKYYGDPPDTPNDAPDAHGSGELRMSKFEAGYEGGLEACGLE
jgi:predicted metalloprotease